MKEDLLVSITVHFLKYLTLNTLHIVTIKCFLIYVSNYYFKIMIGSHSAVRNNTERAPVFPSSNILCT